MRARFQHDDERQQHDEKDDTDHLHDDNAWRIGTERQRHREDIGHRSRHGGQQRGRLGPARDTIRDEHGRRRHHDDAARHQEDARRIVPDIGEGLGTQRRTDGNPRDRHGGQAQEIAQRRRPIEIGDERHRQDGTRHGTARHLQLLEDEAAERRHGQRDRLSRGTRRPARATLARSIRRAALRHRVFGSCACRGCPLKASAPPHRNRARKRGFAGNGALDCMP